MRFKSGLTKAVAEGKAHNAIGLKRLANADAVGKIHCCKSSALMQGAHGLKFQVRCHSFYISKRQGRQGCHQAWRLHAACASPKADTIVAGLKGEGRGITLFQVVAVPMVKNLAFGQI